MEDARIGSGYPRLEINGSMIRRNAMKISELCASRGIALWGVTKGVGGNHRVARAMISGGCAGLFDSRLRNISSIKMSGVNAPIALLRIAMPSEVRDMIHTADMSIQSELRTIVTIDEIAASEGIPHDVLIMVDVGDLREGFWPDELPKAAKTLKNLRGGARVVGVAGNFACATGLLPTRRKFEELVEYRDMLARITSQEMPIVCVGGTCCLKLIESGDVPSGVNMLRAGEAILLGTDTANSRTLDYLEQDTMTLRAEIIECRTKPSLPDGIIGAAAGGTHPTFKDIGRRKRAILALGKQDVMPDKIVPLDDGAEIVTACGDHTVVDVSDAEARRRDAYRPGGILSFRPKYNAMLTLSTSRYVDTEFIEDDGR